MPTVRMGLGILALLVTGCSYAPYSPPSYNEQASAEVIAPGPPPAPRYEATPPPPTGVVVWEPGHWNWNGRDWEWAPGQYVARAQPDAQWIPGHWAQRAGSGWVWVPDHWS